MNLKELVAKNPGRIVDDRPMGVFLDMPEETYHGVKAFSYSASKQFERSPLHFQTYLKNRDTASIHPDRQKYKAVHVLYLEPEKAGSILIQNGTWTPAIKELIREKHREGGLVIKGDDFEDAKAIAQSLRSHREASKFAENAISEVSFFWETEGAYFKCRLDRLSVVDGKLFVTDVKNFGDISNERLLSKQIYDMRYHWQAYFYKYAVFNSLGIDPEGHHWLFVEDSAPFSVKVRTCTADMLFQAVKEMSVLINKYIDCNRANLWPSYDQAIQAASFPAYIWSNINKGEKNEEPQI